MRRALPSLGDGVACPGQGSRFDHTVAGAVAESLLSSRVPLGSIRTLPRELKISIRVQTFGAPEMNLYAAWCGKALALSHARSGLSALLSGYLGKSDAFDQALASFPSACADQNEKDHAALKRAIRAGKIKVQHEEKTYPAAARPRSRSTE